MNLSRLLRYRLDAADKISVTIILRRELKPMSQSGYYFRSM